MREPSPDDTDELYALASDALLFAMMAAVIAAIAL
jgi:hypothetical protein